MSEKKRLRKGEAKIQIIACRERIEKLCAAGYGPVVIHEILTKEGIITMTYGGFYEAFRYGEVRKKRRKKCCGVPNVEVYIDQSTRSAPPLASTSPHPTVISVTPSQSPDWSLDKKLASINAEASQNGHKKRGSDSEATEFDSTEIL